MAVAEVIIDTDKLKKDIRVLVGLLNKEIASGINDSAFQLRKIWLDLIDEKIDSPTKFTKRVFVKKATPENLEGVVFIPPLQSEYLRYMVDGETRKVGDVATLKRSILIPIGNKLDRFGNFKFGPKRWIATLEEKVKGAYVADTSKGGKAVFQNKRGGKSKLLAVFKTLVPYKQTLPLEQAAEDFAPVAEKIIEKKLQSIP